MAATGENGDLKLTPLHDLHEELGARMVPFAGYTMPVQFNDGIMAEHLHTRSSAGLFDVSHMGQAFLIGPDHETTARALEALTPSNFIELGLGRQRYTVLLNDEGGIIDDIMVTRSVSEDDDGRLMLVVNAARKEIDYAHFRDRLPDNVRLEVVEERALIAVQGPQAVEVVAAHAPKVTDLAFMSASSMEFDGIDCHVGRAGYTGEDGVEMSVPAGVAEPIARALLADDRVAPIGLGARDSLRLEAGLCLYGHDIDETTSPVEGAITFCMQKRRRMEGGFPGADRIRSELDEKPGRLRVGLLLEGRAPAREGAEIALPGGPVVGMVTSGGFAPTVGAPIAMGYVPTEHADSGTQLELIVRNRRLPARVVEMPFVPNRYYRKPKT
ncbi:MAG: glycine cleavage system aminomethyltransferase GcvT [Roseibium sp.]|uniref:glycine cleavage system aminomethyltransferase GcvT n=1 Tax=Roseibium sp. TaxID=1936156 RepID=UPI001B00ACB8|nr:glycine cleavage system aminomethyltransferase GcvT [Roseibium sp.]MBO6890647.1 glycine cleavage system aminomethyltransferase GcvT [Roseibium sp.]MBO6930090.1 glycine cleavage system aminomethyltransferase GcvT [Roseibium sp.]